MALFNLISLGCAKNLVDSEVMIGSMSRAGWEFVADLEDADIVILNTCGFIQPAVEEAIEEIFALIAVKKKKPEIRIVVVGCLVQRYKELLAVDLPEVDLFVGTEGAAAIADIIQKMEKGEYTGRTVLPKRSLLSSKSPRIVTTPFFRAWMKITEGCDNRCAYCMIPSIRGGLRSRSVEDLVAEALRLEGNGCRELSLIAQDTTAYGRDIYGASAIVRLLKEIVAATSIPWLRLLYLYPSGVTDELLAFVAENNRVLPYFDIPFQHVNSRILGLMNRKYSGDDLYLLIERIRSYLPDVSLRTTFLVGFPGETDNEFLEIESFLRRVRIDHVGVFPYANEEGCAAEYFSNQVAKEERRRRSAYLHDLQAEISTEIKKKYIGRVEPVLVEGESRETNLLLEGRTRFQAPDVDGCLYINEGTAAPGDIVPVRITDTQTYDMVGGIVSNQYGWSKLSGHSHNEQ